MYALESLKMSVFLRNPENASDQSGCVSYSPGLDPEIWICNGVGEELKAPVGAPPSIPLSRRKRQFPMKISTDQYFFPLVLPSSSKVPDLRSSLGTALSQNSKLQRASVYSL